MRITLDDAFLVLAIVVAYVVYRYYKSKKTSPALLADDNEFVIDDQDETSYEAVLDVGLDYRKLPNHFRTRYRYDTYHSKSLYEYRLEQTDVLFRLIEDQHEDIGFPRHSEVRDGVVMETEIRKRDKTPISDWQTQVEEKIANLKAKTEWQKMEPLTFHGLKYFIISKKLPPADARRYLRHELERLKAGEAAFFRVAAQYGLEPAVSSLDRFKLTTGKQELSPDEWKALWASAESCGITHAEFSWGEKLKTVLEKLLRD